jgi:hypothetical protein
VLLASSPPPPPLSDDAAAAAAAAVTVPQTTKGDRIFILGLETLREPSSSSLSSSSSSSSPKPPPVSDTAAADVVAAAAEGTMKERCLLALLASLAAHPLVLHVGPKAALTLNNGRGARLIQTSANANSPYANLQPIWDLGLTGSGQVLGIADTGLDTSSCFFSSSNGVASVAHSSYAGSASNKLTSFDLGQPKVVQYVDYVDGVDEEQGHGTHVAGSALGSIGSGWAPDVSSGATQSDSCSSASDANGVSDCQVPNYFTEASCSAGLSFCALTSGAGFSDGGSNQGACANACYCTLGYFTRTSSTSSPTQGQTCSELLDDSKGVAHGARAAFFDLGNSAGVVSAPPALDTSMFPYAYSAGARVHQNSWGSEGVYTYQVNGGTFSEVCQMCVYVCGGGDGRDAPEGRC